MSKYFLFHFITMKRFDWLFVINLPILHLKILGLWSLDKNSDWYHSYMVWKYIGCSIFGIGCVISETAYLVFIPKDLTLITKVCATYSGKITTMIKAYSLIKNGNVVQELIEILKCDLFQPKSRKQTLLVEKRLILCHKIFKIYYWLAFMFVIFTLILPFLNKSDKNLLPVLAKYPFNHTVSPFYEISYIHQSIGLWYIASTSISTDMLISSFNLYIHSQFTILCNDLEQLHLRDDINSKLFQKIIHHQAILNFVKKSNHFFKFILLSQFFISVIIIALIMFQLSVIDMFSSDFCILLVLLNAVLYEIFLISWFGNEVEEQVCLHNIFFIFFLH